MRAGILFIVAVGLFISGTGYGQDLKLPAILGNHMVLQQNSTVNIWGWAAPGKKVEVTTGWNGQKYKVKADKEGNWLAEVSTQGAGGPFEVTVKSGATIVLKDIMLGEVWVCSGQSNMEWTLARAESAPAEIPQTNIPDIRLFKVEKRIASSPREDVQGTWQVCSPENARDFSAVGYFFGKYLNGELEVPVGLINTSWGGTPSEAWTSREMLKSLGVFDKQLAELYMQSDEEMDAAENSRDSILEVNALQMDFSNKENIGYREEWMQPEYEDQSWTGAACPAEWSTMDEMGMIEGVVWARKQFEVPGDWIGKDLVLELGPIDEMDVTWLNGREVGSMKKIADWDKDRIYHVPGSVVNQKEMVLAIRIVNTVREGGIFGEPDLLRIYPREAPGSRYGKTGRNLEVQGGLQVSGDSHADQFTYPFSTLSMECFPL